MMLLPFCLLSWGRLAAHGGVECRTINTKNFTTVFSQMVSNVAE